MRSGQIDIAELANILKLHRKVSLRMVLSKVDNSWLLQQMLLDVIPQSQKITSWVYHYGQVIFIRGGIPGSRAASWLLSGRGRIKNYAFQTPQLHQQVYWIEYPSHTTTGDLFRLELPHTIYRIHGSTSDNQARDTGPLVANKCPSYPRYDAAVYKLIYGLEHRPSQVSGNTLIIRVAHNEAWIECLSLNPSSISIEIAGIEVNGARLEISDLNDVRFDKKLRKPGRHRITFPGGLPPRLWIMLSRGDKWLDYRDLNLDAPSSSTLWNNINQEPSDVCAEIAGIISRGESLTIEYKQKVPEQQDKMLKSVVAFANTNGGVIVIGVNNDGSIEGINADVQEEKVRITNMIRENVIPEPKTRIDDCKINNKQVLAIYIEKGDSRPYGLNTKPPKFYVRRNASTYPASRDEIRALVLESSYREGDYDRLWSRL